MKKLGYLFFLSTLCASTLCAADSQPSKIGIVNAKKCLEESKFGKQEQANFEKMKVQMESVLMEKEKAYEDIENKLNDEDYLDSISSEAEAELKRKKRTMKQDAMQLQNQYMQTLQQANAKVIQKLSETVNVASEQVAKEAGYDIIINDEATSYFNKQLDVSDRIVKKMDAIYDAEAKEPAQKK